MADLLLPCYYSVLGMVLGMLKLDSITCIVGLPAESGLFGTTFARHTHEAFWEVVLLAMTALPMVMLIWAVVILTAIVGCQSLINIVIHGTTNNDAFSRHISNIASKW